MFQDGAAIGVAAGDEHAQPVRGKKTGLNRALSLSVQAQPEPEGAALSGAAVHTDFTAHHHRELFGDDQAEPGAAVPAGGRSVALGEGSEQAPVAFLADADAGVFDLETQRDGTGFFLLGDYSQQYFADIGEFNRIGGQIGENLAQAPGGAAQTEIVSGRNVVEQLEAFALRLPRQEFRHFRNNLAQVEVLCFHIQFAGLDLGKVEDVIDDGEQGFR